MAHPGNGQTLRGGCGGKQGTGAAEEDLLQLSAMQLVQKLRTKGDGTATAAGTAAVYVLCFLVKNQFAAVHQLPTDADAFPQKQLHQRLFPQ